MDVVKWLVTGIPGVGKTTCVMHIAQQVNRIPVVGFITREIRENGRRMGFFIEAFHGKKALLAHRQKNSPWRVGQYFVFLNHLEAVINDLLNREKALGTQPRFYVIDEIGKMEALSPVFRQWVENVMHSPWPVVATVALKGTGWIEAIKQLPQISILILTEKDRSYQCQKLDQQVQQWLLAAFS